MDKPDRSPPRDDLLGDLASILNRHSVENVSNTPDFVLAEFALRCLDALDSAVNDRAKWYGRRDAPGTAAPVPAPPAEPTGATIRCSRCGTRQEIDFHYTRVALDAITDNASGSTEGRADDTQGGSVSPPDVCVSIAGNGRGCDRPERSARGVASGSQKRRSEAGTAEAGIESGPLAPICAAPAAEPVAQQPEAPVAQQPPLPMVLHCPYCHAQHVDASDEASGWTNPPHRSHLCHSCGAIWRPADLPTTGVATIETRGAKDRGPAQQPEAPPTQDDDLVARLNQAYEDYTQFWGSGDLYGEAAARIESDAERIRELEARYSSALEDGIRKSNAYNEVSDALDASRQRERAERKRGDELWQRCETLALLVEKYVQCYTRQWNPLNGIAEANTDLAIAKRLATPDSAASPTGGEG